MVGYAMDRGGPKYSQNASNSFFPKISRTGFWRFGTDMITMLKYSHETKLLSLLKNLPVIIFRKWTAFVLNSSSTGVLLTQLGSGHSKTD